MAQDDKRGETRVDAQADDATQLKKRARRRLIGAVALALLAAVVLPMVMDHQPASPLKDIQVRIPSPDEGVTQRVAPKPATNVPAREEKAAVAAPEPSKPIAKAPEAPAESRPPPPPEPKIEPKPEVKVQAKPEAGEAPAKALAEAWEVQLGAYQNPASVANLVRKLRDLGIPTYTEKVDTPNGPRTRVRAGPFPTQEAAEKARVRVKIVGVDGPVAKKP
jgi:DedD protein